MVTVKQPRFSFHTILACDYIHATGMTQEEVEELLEAVKSISKK